MYVIVPSIHLYDVRSNFRDGLLAQNSPMSNYHSGETYGERASKLLTTAEKRLIVTFWICLFVLR